MVFLWLHRRNKKKQALEDLNDPHKSLDFGYDMNLPPPGAAKRKRGKRGPPEMIVGEVGADPTGPARKHHAGLSMDMLDTPYMLPAGLSDSRDSIHSMTRSMRDYNDPYRPVTFIRSSSDTARSPRPFNENGSTYSGSTMHNGFNDKSTLVPNAQRISQTYPERGVSLLSRAETKSSGDTSPAPPIPSSNESELPSREASSASSEPTVTDSSEAKFDLPTIPSPSYGGAEEVSSFACPLELPAEELPPPPRQSLNSVTELPKNDSAGGGLQISVDDRPFSDSSYYAEEQPPPPPPKFEEPEEMDYDIDPSMIYTGRFSVDNSAPSQQYPVQNNRLSYMGVRPLPPENPEENAEQRANRIRSFYKEYFDLNRPNPVNAYYEDYDADYTDYYYYDGWYDPDSGGYYQPPPAPWAQPMGRRAMTPPPRGVSRFDGAHDRHYSTMSGGRGPFRGRPPPKKHLPPPKTLKSLPTPHMLKDDAALFNAGDFAPPTSFRELQNGRRPDSPMGTQRPFSPSVRAYTPLVSTFQELSALPSPHELRKSGTFTSLDFSPQVPRFRGMEGAGSRAGSDAGSIRSARSGISAMQMDAVRAGAYRVSRIPKEYVTSKEDLTNQLKPKWNLSTPA